jgi:large subunit ribosomal protein LP1
MSGITETEKEELACVYAALLLHDDGIPIAADKIATLAKALSGRNLDDLISNAGSAGVAVAAAPSAAATSAAPAAEDKKGGKKDDKKKEEEAKKKKEEEEKAAEGEDVDLGFGLFD